jgi:hypothetical protein
MEVYKHETEEIVKRFLERRITFSECKSLLNAAFADVFPRLNGQQLDSLRGLLMAREDRLTKEVSQRAREQDSAEAGRRRLR